MYTRPPTTKAQTYRRINRGKESLLEKCILRMPLRRCLKPEYDRKLHVQGLRGRPGRRWRGRRRWSAYWSDSSTRDGREGREILMRGMGRAGGAAIQTSCCKVGDTARYKCLDPSLVRPRPLSLGLRRMEHATRVNDLFWGRRCCSYLST